MPGEAVELGDGAAGGQQGILACFGRGTGMCATAFEGDVVPFVLSCSFTLSSSRGGPDCRQERYRPWHDLLVKIEVLVVMAAIGLRAEADISCFSPVSQHFVHYKGGVFAACHKEVVDDFVIFNTDFQAFFTSEISSGEFSAVSASVMKAMKDSTFCIKPAPRTTSSARRLR